MAEKDEFTVIPDTVPEDQKIMSVPTKFDPEPRIARLGPDKVWRLDKHSSDRLKVRFTVEITGNLRRADLERFAQALGATAALEFEDGGGGP